MTKPPSLILHEDFLKPLNLNAHQLSKALHVNRSTTARLLNGSQRITPDMAARLAAFFNVPARWWLLMQAEYDSFILEQNPPYHQTIHPLQLDPSVLLTPGGVLRLDDPSPTTLNAPPLSLSTDAISQLPASANPPPPSPRNVRTIRYENGSLALVGDDL
jgi:addiction module HigA family antidote